MSIFETITDIFESIFKRSSPEVQKKQQLKRLDSEIHSFTPLVCQNRMLNSNFGEAVFSLYKYTRILDNLFMATVSNTDVHRQHRFEAQLIFTGYDIEDQNIINSLSYEKRKSDILEETKNEMLVYDRHRRQMEKVLKALNSENFKKMDQDILTLRHFVDFCHYNFMTFVQVFDNNFIPADFSYQPTYMDVEVSKCVNLLEDLYYLSNHLDINTSTASAVLALARMKQGGELPDAKKQELLTCIKKIAFIINKVIPDYRLKALIRLAKEDVLYEPKAAVYSGSPRQEFADMFQEKFNADEKRIKIEVQDETISKDVEALFNGFPLENVYGYNNEINKLLQDNTALSFTWVLPIRVLKTFSKVYVSEGVRALLNDIIIEGFFNNSNYKTSFSSTVYTVIGMAEQIASFEASFGDGKKNSISVLKSYILDSNKDKDFYKRLESMVFSINKEANVLLQSICTSLNTLYKEMGALIADSKRPSSEIISNIKVLMLSSRNRDNSSMLERQYSSWQIFFDIMKNYVIINNGEK